MHGNIVISAMPVYCVNRH